jgi:hypothetical protein
MKTTLCVVFTYLALTLIGVNAAQGSDCPGFRIQCRSDAVSACGAACVASFSCSLNTCTCSFACKPTCTAPSSAVLLRDPINIQLASVASSDTKYSSPDFHLDLVSQPDVPLTISGVEIRNDSGRQLSELEYSLRNEAGSKLRAIHILLTFFNDRNEPSGGERLSLSPSLNQGENHQFVVSLSHYVESGQRVAIAITDFETETQTWHGDHKVVIGAMKRR